jgi:hypothetical protein
MMRTFLFIVYDIVSHIERKINYFILFYFFKEWNHCRKSSEQIIQHHWSLWIRHGQVQHRLL